MSTSRDFHFGLSAPTRVRPYYDSQIHLSSVFAPVKGWSSNCESSYAQLALRGLVLSVPIVLVVGFSCYHSFGYPADSGRAAILLTIAP
jgi:hypothetical protein